jgi:hypothetical protein
MPQFGLNFQPRESRPCDVGGNPQKPPARIDGTPKLVTDEQFQIEKVYG